NVALTANTAGVAGNSITITVDNTRLTKTAFHSGDDADALVQPFHVAYDYGESREIKVLSKTPKDLCLVFDGDNLAVPGEHMFARIRRSSLGPAAKVSLKSGSSSGTPNTANEYEIKGRGLVLFGENASDGYGVIKIY